VSDVLAFPVATCIEDGCDNPRLTPADEPKLTRSHVHCREHYDRWCDAFREGRVTFDVGAGIPK
jgi:hypothetical protein